MTYYGKDRLGAMGFQCATELAFSWVKDGTWSLEDFQGWSEEDHTPGKTFQFFIEFARGGSHSVILHADRCGDDVENVTDALCSLQECGKTRYDALRDWGMFSSYPTAPGGVKRVSVLDLDTLERAEW